MLEYLSYQVSIRRKKCMLSCQKFFCKKEVVEKKLQDEIQQTVLEANGAEQLIKAILKENFGIFGQH